MKNIIPSVIDDDLYKVSQQQAVFQLYPDAIASYKFVNRGKDKFPDGFGEQLREQINSLGELSLTESEEYFLRKIPFLRPTFVDFLKGFKFDPSQVRIKQIGENLDIEIEGPWYSSIRWEVPLMAIICEQYFSQPQYLRMRDRFTDKAITKALAIEALEAKFSEFGTRRRFSHRVQEFVIMILKKHSPNSLIGTSNLYFAKMFDMNPIGTQAHEWYMAHAAMYGYLMANHMGMQKWVEVYQGDLGIALTDTFTTDIFLKSFDKFYSRLFDGVRHDSDDPFVFTDKVCNHYKNLKIDPTTKLAVFSDGISSIKMISDLTEYCNNKIRCGFGIGTWLTNDVDDIKPLNIVVKMNKFKINKNSEWRPTVKLSDAVGKNTGNQDEILRAKRELCLMR